MIKKPLYLFLCETASRKHYVLQLRQHKGWIQRPFLRYNDAGELVLHKGDDIITLAEGTKSEVIEYAHRMFCAVPLDFESVNGTRPNERQWEYLGDYCWSFRLGLPSEEDVDAEEDAT